MLLHHYTTTTGLMGILQSGNLWATDAAYLNDSQEIFFSQNLMIKELERSLKELEQTEATGPVETILSPMLDAALYYMKIGPTRLGPYITCFCEEGDLLSQWRGYAGGSGWALGFDSAILGGPEIAGKAKASLRQVAYGEDAAARTVQRTLDEYKLEPAAHPHPSGEAWAHTCRVQMATVKHAAFQEEKEWRLIVSDVTSSSEEDFRSGLVALTPYVTISWPKQALQKVTIGPTPHPALQERALRRLLDRLEFPDSVLIVHSEAPYR